MPLKQESWGVEKEEEGGKEAQRVEENPSVNMVHVNLLPRVQ